MEKMIEEYTMEKVFKVIDKHRSYFKDMMQDTSLRMRITDAVMDDPSEIVEIYIRDLHDYASALACLEMLEKELKGEVEY